MNRILFAACLICLFSGAAADAKPLKVYILCGQSNMEGHARTSTFEAIGMDPATKPLLKDIVGPDGEPKSCEKVWISYFTGGGDKMGEGFGKLTAGYGSRKDPATASDKIGPEFGFGIYMEKALDEPILIIKTAWGGKSLYGDFRPPSAGPYEFNESELANFKKRGKDVEAEKKARAEKDGHFYRLMTKHVNHVLSDIKRVYPDYNAKDGYELAGFVWFQGWNDMVNGGVYPERGKPGGYDAYSEVLAHFIRDVRKEFKAPNMKFVIGVMGAGGPLDKYASQRYVPIHGGFRRAMAAPAVLPEFRGNVVAVETAPFWDMKLKAIQDKKGRKETLTADEQAYVKIARSNAEFHYNGSAKTMVQIGKAFAEAMLD